MGHMIPHWTRHMIVGVNFPFSVKIALSLQAFRTQLKTETAVTEPNWEFKKWNGPNPREESTYMTAVLSSTLSE